MSLGPFDLNGSTFLALYLGLLAAASILALLIPGWIRPQGRAQRVTDPDQLAFLAGGMARFGETLVARLLASGALVMAGRKSFAPKPGSDRYSAAERRILVLPAPIGWREIERVLRSQRESIERQMVASGLLESCEALGDIRFRAILPFLLLFAFGATKWVVGESRDRPTGFLTALLAVTALLALLRWITIDRRTRAGKEALASAREEAGRLSIAPTAPEIGLAVALFGTTVLAGSAWSDFHDLRRSSGSGDAGTSSSDSSGDGGGDGGGGGGGCGGCGS